MPWLNNDDMATLRVCERWQQTAFDEIDDIGIWRNTPEDAVFRTEGSYLTDSFCPDDRVRLRYLETSNIVAYVSRKFPMLDGSPVLRVYESVNAWHNDRNADRLPPQLELCETLDRAIIVLAVVHDEIYSRATAHPPASETKLPDGPPVSRIAARPAWNKGAGELRIGGRSCEARQESGLGNERRGRAGLLATGRLAGSNRRSASVREAAHSGRAAAQ